VHKPLKFNLELGMKVLVNASTINVGGGLFVTVNFIKECINNPQNGLEWFYLISDNVNRELKRVNILLSSSNFEVISNSPARIVGRKKVLDKISRIERKENPDIIYSIGAPSYVNFENIEIQRLTNPYITHSNLFAINSYSFIDKYKIQIKSFIQKRIISKSKYFITQSKTAQKGIVKLTNGKEDYVAVIPNSLADVFKSVKEKNKPTFDNYIFCLAAPYPHKNIHEIPRMARKLLDKDFDNFKFVVTIPEDDPTLKSFHKKCKDLEVCNRILNVGKISQLECKEWYLKSKLVFLPTYLETFSATLLEALYLKVPIVTTNFDFNTDVSGKYALYFDPGNWDKAVDQILKLLTDNYEREKIIMPNSEFDKKFKSFSENYKETIFFLKKVLDNEH